MFRWVAGAFGVVRTEKELSSQTERVSHLFTWFLLAQLVMGIGITCYIARQPDLVHNYFHSHILECGLIAFGVTIPALVLTRILPKGILTRHLVALTVMLQSLFLIIATGGRIEGHFSVFTCLAILA